MSENLDKHKVGVVAATIMVAGNIMGSGVFMLPANLAATGGIAIFGWLVTITGAVSLAMVYARMSAIDDSPGGSYAYAKRAFGPFVGYQTNLLYWLAGWIGNVALAVVGVGYLSYFFPILKEPWVLGMVCVAVMWLFTLINIVGPNLVARVQSVTTILALIAIIGVAIIGWFGFSWETYMDAWNVSGKDSFGAVQGVLNVTLWSFIGVETAAVAAGVVKNPKKNVPIATIGGVSIAAVTYVLSCTAIMGAIPNDQLIKSAAPFADAAKLALGNTGGAIVSFCAAVGCLGSLGGWILATAQSGESGRRRRSVSAHPRQGQPQRRPRCRADRDRHFDDRRATAHHLPDRSQGVRGDLLDRGTYDRGRLPLRNGSADPLSEAGQEPGDARDLYRHLSRLLLVGGPRVGSQTGRLAGGDPFDQRRPLQLEPTLPQPTSTPGHRVLNHARLSSTPPADPYRDLRRS